MDDHKPCILYITLVLARSLLVDIALFTKTIDARDINLFVFVIYRHVFTSLVQILVTLFERDYLFGTSKFLFEFV